MKLMFAGDIHGSAKYCRLLLEAYDREGAQRLILLGDLLNHGPRNGLNDGYDPMQVADMLNGRADELLCVRGNCDSEVDQMVLDFPMMADYALMPLGDRIVFITHGHLFNEQQLPKLKKGDILVHGHTHIAAINEHESYTYINPGSTTIPKNELPQSYMVFENGAFTIKSLDGRELMSYTVK